MGVLAKRSFEISDRRAVRYTNTLDAFRRYLTDAMTPASLANVLASIDQGDIAAMVEINQEMEGKDAHLQGVANTRRQAVTALDWEVVPDVKLADDDLAIEAAEYVQDELANLVTFPETLEHMSTAIGPGIAVTELIWRAGHLVETVDVPGHRLMCDPFDKPGIFIETGGSLVEGIPTPRGKFAIFTPNADAGFPLRVTITRAQAYLYVIKHYALGDWAAFLEMFGKPWRIATVEEGTPTGDVDAVRNMLRDMNSDAYGVFTKGVEIEFKEASRGTEPFSAMIDLIERKQSILYLGQTLTTEMQSTGSFAAARVHDNVRASILLSDIKKESRMIGSQIMEPMVNLRFPGTNAPIPVFKRRIIEARNLDADRVAMDQIRLLREAGLPIDAEVMYDKLDIPMPANAPTGPVQPSGQPQDDNRPKRPGVPDVPSSGAPAPPS